MKDLFSLKGKKVLITGGAGYFGQYFVRGLLDYDVDKVINIEYPGKAKSFHKELVKKYGAKHIGLYEVDLYDVKAVDKIYDKIIKENKNIDVLVNNAFEFSPRTGFAPDRSGVLEKATHDQLLTSFEAGVWWAFQATQKFGFEMKRRGKGSIINISSPAGVRAISPKQYEGFEHAPNPPGYGIAKAGLLALMRYSATFLAPVRVNALSPGAIPNLKEKHERAGKSYKDEFLDRLAERMALGRCGRPEELVGGLIFLASEASSYVTGHNLLIDGGWTMHL